MGSRGRIKRYPPMEGGRGPVEELKIIYSLNITSHHGGEEVTVGRKGDPSA